MNDVIEGQAGDQAADISALSSLARDLPLPVAQCLTEYSEKGSPALIFAIESALRLLAMIVKSTYLARPCRPSLRMNDVMRRCLFRPSMGDWWTFLRESRRLIESGEIPAPFEELVSLVAGLDAQRGIDRAITLRNTGYGHIGSPPTPEVERAITAELLPLTVRTLSDLLILAKYPLVVFDATERRWLRCMGPVPAPQPDAPAIDVHAPAAMLAMNGGDLPLFPLVVGNFDDYQPDFNVGAHESVLVFDGIDVERKRLVYVGRHGRGYGKRWFEDYRRRLEERSVPVVPYEVDEVASSVLIERAHASFAYLHELALSEGRIHEDVDRLDAGVAGPLDDAVASSATVAIVSGEAGMGKTTHLLAGGLRWSRAGHVVVYLDARYVLDPKRPVGDSLRVAIAAQLGVLGSPERIFQVAQAALSAERGSAARIVFLLDGLDEIGAPSHVRTVLAQLGDWLVRQKQLTSLRVVLAIRPSYLEALRRAGDPLARLSCMLYRPTRKGIAGRDEVEHVIWLTPPKLDLAEVSERYEAYRRSSCGHRPLTAFSELGVEVREACRNPRWMVQLLRSFDGREVPALCAAFDLWDELVRSAVFELAGQEGKKIPRFPGRVKVIDALVRAQLVAQNTAVTLSVLESDPAAASYVNPTSAGDELTMLQSMGVVCVEGSDPRDPFAEVLVRPVNDGVAAALLRRSQPFRNTAPDAWVTLLLKSEGSLLWGPLSEAVVVALARRAREEGWAALGPALERLDASLEARLVLQALAAFPDLPIRRADHDRERGTAVLQALLRIAWTSGEQRRLLSFAEAVAAESDDMQTDASVALVAASYRHAEKIDAAEAWLRRIGTQRIDLREAAWFHLAELLRDKGEWRKASGYYELVAEHAKSTARSAHALAGRGECEIWLKENEKALSHLGEALQRLGDADVPDVRCNIHIKRGIAGRLVRRYPFATKELVAAERLAAQHHFRTEQAKIMLELGLVAHALGNHDEALSLVDEALARHCAQGFIKGRKKATYCRGYVLEGMGRVDDAIVSYRESLALNEQYFDVLGLQLTYGALGRSLEKTSPDEAQGFKRKAAEMKARSRQVDNPDEQSFM